MKQRSCGSLGRLAPACVLLALLLPVLADDPGWWSVRGVIDTNATVSDYGAANQGQAKHVAHMGWNEMGQGNASPLFEGVADRSFFYFAHSYYVEPEDTGVIVGVTDYGGSFVSAVGRGNVFGVQFHPEKSGPRGLAMLANFCRICDEG